MRDRVARVLASRGWHKTRIVPVINAVDTGRYVPGDRAEAKRQMGVSADTPVFLMAANLAPHKGQETAIRAVARLLGQGHRPQLWLVGEEREKAGFTEQLHRCAADLGAGEQVRFLGFRNDIPKLLHAADCLLLPSTREGLPLSILEAQASKVVVLAAPTAGIPEVIEHGRTGFLIDAHDAEGYASALAMLLTNPAKAEAVREAAYRQVIDSFTLKRYCARILEQYDEVLA
jgi:glycosyltransferase involved in cell wall biosynthesis